MNDSPSFEEAIEISHRLWDLSFPDEGPYTDFYFSRRCTEEVILCLHKTKETFDSAFQLFPYKMNLKGAPSQILYMSGVCTHPKMRNKGRMGLCMKENIEQLTGTDTTLVMLIPANEELFTYYHRFGFTEVSARQIIKYHNHAASLNDELLHIEDIPLVSATAEQRHHIYKIFRHKWESMPSSIIHTEKDFQSVLDAYIPDNLHLLSGSRQDKLQEPTAAALYSEHTSEILVHDHTEEALLSYLYNKTTTSKGRTENKIKAVNYFSYDNKPFMMARILNAQKAITLYSEINKRNANIHLTDKWLECNSGYYSTTSGKITKTEKPINGIQYIQMTSEELTAHLFQDTALHASLMLDY